MTPIELSNRLAKAAAEGDYAVTAFDALVAELPAPTLESIEIIFRFMEENPDVDYGTPGPLVHYIERLDREHEPKLLESLRRRPVDHTVWMLNRILNATEEPDARRRLLAAMSAAGRHPDADAHTQERVEDYLDHQATR